MTVNLLNQARAAGNGTLGRLILLADVTTLSTELLNICVTDLLASMISISEAATSVTDGLTPDLVVAISAFPGMSDLDHVATTLRRELSNFDRLGAEVRQSAASAQAASRVVDEEVAIKARLWAHSALSVREALSVLNQKLTHLRDHPIAR